MAYFYKCIILWKYFCRDSVDSLIFSLTKRSVDGAENVPSDNAETYPQLQYLVNDNSIDFNAKFHNLTQVTGATGALLITDSVGDDVYVKKGDG